MPGGGQPNNENAKRGREWRNAINRALEKRGNGDRTKALDALAEKFLDAVEEMTVATEKRGPSINGFAELADRIDGKVEQGIEVSGNLGLAQVLSGISASGSIANTPSAKDDT